MELLILQFDQRVADFLFVSRDLVLIKFFSWVTFLGNSKTIILFLVITSLIFWVHKNLWHICGLFFSVVGSEVFTYILKNWFERPRPTTAYYLEHSFSFPSGHATAAVSFYGFVIYYLFYKLKSKKIKNIILFFGIIIALLIGFSRLYLGVHYLSDVFVGYLVGLFWLIISIGAVEWKCRQESIVK